jgi:predicted small secreted protein
MISYARFIIVAVACLLVAACEQNYVVGFDYRVASRDPKVSSAQMLRVVADALERGDASVSGQDARAWAKIDEKTGEVTFTLGAFGSGKTPSIRNTETRVLRALRYEFGEKVEVFCNGEPLR